MADHFMVIIIILSAISSKLDCTIAPMKNVSKGKNSMSQNTLDDFIRIKPQMLQYTSKYVLLDCFYKNTAVIPEYGYDIHEHHEPNKFKSAQECQWKCQEDSDCFFFQYNNKDQKCWLKTEEALLSVKTNETSNKFVDKQYANTNDFIFGPKYCSGMSFVILRI